MCIPAILYLRFISNQCCAEEEEEEADFVERNLFQENT